MTVELGWLLVAALLLLTGVFYVSPYEFGVDEIEDDE